MKKLVFDISLAAVITPFALPVMAAVSAGVAISVGWPIIFTQQRRGKNDEPFTIYKFRSMTNARDDTGRLLPDAQRMTRFGRFIRMIGLDELPQLFNIFKGDMSFVGPRPRSLHAHDKNNDIPEMYKNILSISPGLTGPAQVERMRAKRVLSLQEKLKLDWDYATKPVSLKSDLRVIAQTLPIFIRGNGSSSDRHFKV